MMSANLNIENLNFSIAGLRQHYIDGDFTPMELLAQLRESVLASDNPAFISLLSVETLERYCSQLPDLEQAPLFGIPFAIKDNIDLAGVPTTAGCPAYEYCPEKSAHVVQRLLDAGAIPLGKTNMDQFATGLVGVRSPEKWGACYNTLNNEYISGGSSSGSAVAVANGWVAFSLGTDTAGSGRVPASLNNIVGLKPSCGLLSNTGVVPACKSIDCVSIFALTAMDANHVFDIAADYDVHDPFARENPFGNSKRYFSTAKKTFRYGVPKPSQLQFFGNDEAEALFANATKQLQTIGGQPVEIDFSAFLDAAKLLYEGPWVAERFIVIKELLANQPEEVLPVIRSIVKPGGKPSAVDVYSSIYRLNELKQLALQQFSNANLDLVVTPTNGTVYTVDEVNDEPIQLNSNLGYYTNFMNLLDFSAIAVPTGFYQNGVGFGVTLFAKAFSDKALLSLAETVQQQAQLTLGATGQQYQAAGVAGIPPTAFVDVVVCGAHLEGLPLNWQLVERGAVKQAVTLSAQAYKLYALPGGPPYRPAMIRDESDGQKIELEIWRLPIENFGSFVAEIPAPLGIGKVQLVDGRWLPGFMCEGAGIFGAKDITHHGGWRAYLSA